MVPGDASQSLLIKAIRHTDPDFEMPPKKKLPAEVIADFEKWIAIGAPDPLEGKGGALTTIHLVVGRTRWAFLPLATPPGPEAQEKSGPRTDHDRLHPTPV